MSRYPAPNQMRSAYDRSLLTTAPTPTRAERQAGYDVNALEQGEYYVSNTRPKPPPPAPAVNPFADQTADQRQQPAAYSPAPSPEPYQNEPKKPFYKTKKGRIVIGLAIIVFIGIIAGIAAGAAAARQSKNTTLIGDNSQDLNNANSPSSSSRSPTPSQINEPASSSDSTPTSTQGQDPAATLTFGNGNGNGNVNPTPTVTPISQNPTSSSSQGTTLVFGGTPQPSSGTNSGSNNSGGSSGNSGNDGTDSPYGDIPPGCYITPLSRSCCPYFFDNC